MIGILEIIRIIVKLWEISCLVVALVYALDYALDGKLDLPYQFIAIRIGKATKRWIKRILNWVYS